METEAKAVFELMKECLWSGRDASGSSLPPPESELWPKIYSLLKAQDVFSLAAKWLETHKLADEALYADWSKACFDIQLRSLKLMAAQEALVRLFEKAEIPFVVIKGSAAAHLYPSPFHRAMGDIDVLVRRADFERASALMKESGYAAETSGEGFHHIGFKKGGAEIELHRRLGSVPEDNESLLALFEGGIGRRVEGAMGAFRFPMLPAELNGLVLLLHINQHLRVGLGLRQMIDWMFFVSEKLDDSFFEEKFRPLTDRLGLTQFAVSMTAFAEEYLGLEKSRSWSAGADQSVLAELAEYIINKGSFGKHGGKRERISSVYLRAKNPFKLLGMLQKAGRKSWPAAKKHPILRPFCWAYQLKKTRSDLKKNKVSAKEMKKLRSDGLRQRKLIESLGLDVDNKLHTGLE